MRRKLLKIAGIICVGLGFIGAFVPLLPTTPFLLLAIFLFARSDPGYSRRILHHRILGPYIAGYSNGRGIPLRIKVQVISILWLSMIVSCVFFTESLWVRILLLSIATGVTVHLCLFKTDRIR